MTSSAQEKIDTAAASQLPVSAKTPALIAFHVAPAPKGKQPMITTIGAAVAHPDGEGFTLQLNLIPTNGGRIILRLPTAKKVA